MFNKILVPLDGSDLAGCVLPHVIGLANATGAAISLLHVVDQQAGSTEINPWDWQFARVEAELYLDEIKTKLLPLTTHEPECKVLEGNAAERIAEVLQEDEIDLAVLSSHGLGGLHGWNMGGLAQKVIANANKSILLVRAATADEAVREQTPGHEADQANETGVITLGYQRILVPLDGSPRAEAVLPLATSLAETYHADLLLAHIVAPPVLFQRTPPTPADRELCQQFVGRNQTQATAYLEDLQSRLSPTPRIHVQVGDSVTQALHKLSTDEQCDLTIVCAHGGRGSNDFPYSDTVVNLIAFGQIPLLILQDQPMQRSAAAPKRWKEQAPGRSVSGHGTGDIISHDFRDPDEPRRVHAFA